MDTKDVYVGLRVVMKPYEQLIDAPEPPDGIPPFVTAMKKLCGHEAVVVARDMRISPNVNLNQTCWILTDINEGATGRLNDLSYGPPNTDKGWYIHPWMFESAGKLLDIVTDHSLTLIEQLESANESQYQLILEQHT